ncbi:MAG TPA: LptA/OstA family protein [Candidatus Polarisedimenticolaceae bacterium]
MARLRGLRLAIPILLVAGAASIWLVLRRSDRPVASLSDVGPGTDTHIEGFTFTDLVGGRRRLSVSAKLGSFDAQGGFTLEGVERIEIDREGADPLVLRADRGSGAGAEGRRVIRLDGGVEMRDAAAGLQVRLPSIEIDQIQGTARSLGEVEIEAPGWRGTASAAVYGLAKGATSELYRLEASTVEGATLVAGRVAIDRSTGALRLDGGVDYRAGTDQLRADDATAERDENGRVRRLTANGSVQGVAEREPGKPTSWRAAQADVTWDAEGRVTAAILRGNASIEQPQASLLAATIEAAARAEGGFDVDAEGGVVWNGMWGGSPARLQCGTLEGVLDAAGTLRQGQARDGVRFEGRDAAGEADRATFAPGEPFGKVTLEAAGTVRARVRSGRTRVVADRIVASARGDRLEAEGRVEATLLPDAERTAAGAALFDAKQTVHFVAGRLESEDGGRQLRFRQAVRGWQEDRTLSADEVDADAKGDALDARGKVATRLPRGKQAAASDADYLEVTSNALAYRGAESQATYTGNVRARLAEGWFESARLVVLLRKPEGGIREVRAFDNVRLEFADTDEQGMPRPVTGKADRLVWDPVASVARLFGDKAPAEVRREGEKGGTTTGRVLRYRLDADVVEVESTSERAP